MRNHHNKLIYKSLNKLPLILKTDNKRGGSRNPDLSSSLVRMGSIWSENT